MPDNISKLLPMADDRYCVIGAGAAGLGTMEVLQRHGIAFDCFEQSDRVGGHWHTDYESLHLITSRDLSGFTGYPMPSEYPVYPSRDQMRDYLERFASDTGVRAHVRFGVRVERIEPVGRDGWLVTTSDGETRLYTGVIVCNGHLWDQNVPTYPGEFTGPPDPLRLLPVDRRHRGHARADGRRGQLGLRPRGRRRQRAAAVDDLDPARADVPAQGRVRPPAGRDRLAGEAARAAQRAHRARHVRPGDRAHARLPRAPGAADPQPQRAAAGGQQPAAVLDPPRPDRRRGRDRAAGRAHGALRRRDEPASSTRSCGRPGSR